MRKFISSFPGYQRGFSLVSAIFLLVVIAALGAFALTLSTNQHQSDAMDVMGKRAYQAARAGIEYGVYEITLNHACPPLPTVTLTDPYLSSFTVSLTCTVVTASDPNPLSVYTLTSTANNTATVGSTDYVERQLSVNIAP